MRRSININEVRIRNMYGRVFCWSRIGAAVVVWISTRDFNSLLQRSESLQHSMDLRRRWGTSEPLHCGKKEKVISEKCS